MKNRTKYLTEKRAAVFLLFLAAFFAGNLAAAVITNRTGSVNQSNVSQEGTAANQPSANQEGTAENQPNAIQEGAAANQSNVSQGGAAANQASSRLISGATEGSWGLSFQEEGQPPVANATFEELAQYQAYYAKKTDEKRIYLTFDCGYENGNTPAILEALKKHGVPATFFVVGNFVRDEPELVRQMLADHHTVGNHTEHHPDMSKMGDLESFRAEIEGLEQLFLEATGEEISKYYRPPQGKYSEANLKMAQELGYQTFFWSLAYVDWYADQQPTKEEAFEKLLGRIHPGAIVLLHNTSSTNGAILDELLTRWEEMGYTFGTLEELTSV